MCLVGGASEFTQRIVKDAFFGRVRTMRRVIYVVIVVATVIVPITSYVIFWSFFNYPKNIETDEGKDSIIVDWSDISKLGFSRYELYRQEKGGIKAELVAGNIVQSLFEDKSAEEKKEYMYSVKAVNVLGFRTKAILTNEIFWSSPAQPSHVILKIQGSDVELTWDESMESDILGYSVHRSSESGAAGEKITTEFIPENYFLDQDVSIDVDDYYYRIKAVDRAGNESEASDQVTYLLDNPSALKVIEKKTSLVLSWDSDVVEDFSHYNVYRSIRSSGDKEILEKGVKVKQYQDFNTENGIDFYYWVKVFDKKGFRSGFSPTASGRWEAPLPPENLRVKKLEEGVMELTWFASPESDVVGYNVYASIGSNSSSYTAKINDKLITSLSYIDEDVNTSRDIYYYRLKAVDSAGNESNHWSQMVKIKLNPDAQEPKFNFTKQPIVVTGLTVERTYENQDLVMVIRWNPVTDPRFSHYEICAPSAFDPCSDEGKVVAPYSVFTNEYIHKDFVGEAMFYYVRAVYKDARKSNYTRFFVKRDGFSFESAPNVGDVIDGTPQ